MPVSFERALCAKQDRGRQLILINPMTYMNLSGKAVKYWMDKENITLENTLIVTDDIALPFEQFAFELKEAMEDITD